MSEEIELHIHRRMERRLASSGTEIRPMKPVDEESLLSTIAEIIDLNRFHFDKIKEDEKHLIYLVGQVMQKLHGKCDPNKVSDLILTFKAYGRR